MIEAATNVDLRAYSTFHIGGPADMFVRVTSPAMLRDAVQFAQTEGLPYHVIGEGSNILFSDHGVRGLVIKNDIGGTRWTAAGTDVLVRVGAGVHFDELVAESVEKGLWGLENLSGIPGSVGATPIQNVGAYGVEVGSRIHSVEVYDREHDTFAELSPSECAFGYRDSIFKHDGGARYAVTHVTFALSEIVGPVLSYRDLAQAFSVARVHTYRPRDIRETVLRIRAGKFPDWHSVGTAGSFFKNPVITHASYQALRLRYPSLPGYTHGDDVKVPLGFILDHICGVRGMRTGFVRTYEHQALVIVAERGARAHDVRLFADDIASRVRDAVGITIEWEVTFKE